MANPVPQHPFQPAPEIRAFLDTLKRIGNDLDTMTAENVAALRSLREQRAQDVLWSIPVERVSDLIIPGNPPIPARLYVPDDKQLAHEGLLPLILYFHGGGWTLGSVNCYDSITRYLTRQIPAMVVSVDYRLAPEHPFPAAVEDAQTALSWVAQHAEEIGADRSRIVVAGDSAGGNLAIVSARRKRTDGGASPIMQVLFYPSTDISSTAYASYAQYGEDHLLTRGAVERFREFYLPKRADWTLPDASPLLADNWECSSPTLLIGGGCDPLRDEWEAYGRKLRDAGTRVIYRIEPHLIHAFLSLYNLEPNSSPYAEAVLAYAAGVIRQELRVHLRSEARSG